MIVNLIWESNREIEAPPDMLMASERFQDC